MKINVFKIDGNHVHFVSKYGVASGLWKDVLYPQKKTYFVEIDTVPVIKYDDIKVSANYELHLTQEKDKIFVSALLYTYEDGCATLQFDEDIIEVVTEPNNKFRLLCGKYISFYVSLIELYDEHLY